MCRTVLPILLATCASAAQLVPLEAVELVTNGGFEQGVEAAAGWSVGTAPEGVKLTWSTDRPHGGTHCAGVASGYAEDRPWFPWTQQLNGLEPGGKYQLSAWVRSQGATRGGIVTVHFSDGHGRNIDLSQGIPVGGDLADWTRLTREITVPAAAASGRLLLSMHGPGTIWFDDVSLQRPLTPTHQGIGTARVYPLTRAEGPVKLDGNNRDWEGVPRSQVTSAVTVSQAQAVVLDKEAWGGADDLSLNLALQYDDQQLYVLLSVRDDRRVARQPYWSGDSLQLAIDPNYTRSLKGWAPSDLALGLPLADKGPAVAIEHGPKGLKPEDLTVGRHDDDGWYLLELGVPWGKLGLAGPPVGGRLGFNVIVNDNDGAGRKWCEWTPGIATSKSPAQFGTLLVMGTAPLALNLAQAAEPLRDVDPALLSCEVVSVADQPQELQLTVRVDGGEDRRTVTVTPGVTSVPLAYAPGSFTAGTQTVTLSAGDLRSSATIEVLGIRLLLDETEARLTRLRASTEQLGKLVAKGRAARLDLAAQDVTLATAECFLRWIPADLARTGHESLALREATRLEPLVARATAECEAILAQPANHPQLPPQPVQGAAIRDGGWYAGDQPVFLLGFCSGPPTDELAYVPRFGGNLAGFSAGLRWWLRNEPGDLAKSPAAAQLKSDLRAATDHGLLVDILFAQALPEWAAKDHPDLRAVEGHFCEYDLDHPYARKLMTEFLTGVGRVVRDDPTVISYDLWNEASYANASPRGLARFRAAMARQYGTIARLNEVWGTSYESFERLPQPARDPGQPAAYADWCRWNDARVTDWFATLRDAVREGDPKADTHVKVGNELAVSGTDTRRGPPARLSGYFNGVDRVALAKLCEIQGCDTRPTPLSDDYAFAWRYPGMAYDLQRSLAPDKPIFDSEWHGIQTVYFEDPDIPAEHLRASLWFSYLHGLDANLIWWWSRRGTEPKQQWFEGSLCAQPQLLDAFGRNNLEVQRHGREIVAFQDAPPPLRLLYSSPSARLDLGYLDLLGRCYEELSWYGIEVGYADESMLADPLPGCRVLVIPAAKHASAGVREALAKLAVRGVLVVQIGADCLTLDPHGQPLAELPQLPGLVVQPDELVSGLSAALAQAGVPTPVQCLGPDGRTTKPVAFRTVELDGRRLAYLLGLGKQPASVRLVRGGQAVSYRSLLTGETFSGPRTIAPLEFDLVELR